MHDGKFWDHGCIADVHMAGVGLLRFYLPLGPASFASFNVLGVYGIHWISRYLFVLLRIANYHLGCDVPRTFSLWAQDVTAYGVCSE